MMNMREMRANGKGFGTFSEWEEEEEVSWRWLCDVPSRQMMDCVVRGLIEGSDWIWQLAAYGTAKRNNLF